MYQPAFCCLTRLCVQPGNLFPAGMEIASYNDHYRLLLPQSFLVLNTQKDYMGPSWSLRSYPINSSRCSMSGINERRRRNEARVAQPPSAVNERSLPKPFPIHRKIDMSGAPATTIA